MSSDVDTAAVAALIANRARCAMLDALFDGGERTAGSLAEVARIARSTASGHLRMLAEGGLVVLESRGRHQYVRLAGPQVAHALEALSTIAPTTASTGLRASDRALALRRARTCYDHLAGALGVALTDALCAEGILTAGELQLTPHGAHRLERFGIDVARLRRRPPPDARLPGLEREAPASRGRPRGRRLRRAHRARLDRSHARAPHRPPHAGGREGPRPGVRPPPDPRPCLTGGAGEGGERPGRGPLLSRRARRPPAAWR